MSFLHRERRDPLDLDAIRREHPLPGIVGAVVPLKAEVPKPKLSLGRVTGGAVQLTPPARSLILTEGVEDALSLIQMTGKSAWAALGTSNLGRVVLPIQTEDVVIGADGDDAGEAAAQKAAVAYAERGCRVRVIRSLPGFKDFNQEIQERGSQ